MHVGGQDLHEADDGPFTGEVSVRTLCELGCTHAEVGHAERRRLFGEDDSVVARKTAAALRHGLVPVLCVGEPDRVPPAAAATRCTDEVDRLLSQARADAVLGPLTVAYEPHWAIGADQPAPVPHIAEV